MLRTAPAIAVVKCGGHLAVDAAAVCADVAALVRSGRHVVVVHGGSTDIDRLGAALGVPARRLVAPDGVSARRTDGATMEVVTLALAGAVKPRLVRLLAAAGAPAVGLTGLDGGLLTARRKVAHRAVVDGRLVVVRDNHAGVIERVDGTVVELLLEAGFTPVVSPPALTDEGDAVNVDADRVAAALAVALRAEALVLLTGAPGVLSDPADEGTVLGRCVVELSGSPPFRAGGMGLKLVAGRAALAGGVPTVVVADGRVARPVAAALAGAGTRIELASTVEVAR